MHSQRRASYEEFSIPYGRVCVKLGLTPNVLTALGLLSAAAAGVALWQEWFLLGVALILLASILDMLDGATARAGNLGTTFGTVLDHNVDRFGEFLVILGIMLSERVAPGWGMFSLFGMWSASYARAVAESKGGLRSCTVGLMGRFEKFVLIIIGAILEIFFPFVALEIALIVVGVVSLVTTGQRLVFTHRELSQKDGSRP